jgi:hypothetical protein
MLIKSMVEILSVFREPFGSEGRSKVCHLDDVILFRVERMMDDGERVGRRRDEIDGRVDNELGIRQSDPI